ncbi:MAG TPA: hypothetical protein PK598_13610, partial [Thermoanaerobaculia bacterium]|nr:hypothetical protein [Thermoanaerobaculia bacterium]
MASIESLRGRSAVGVAALLAALFFPVAGLADDEKPKAAPESPAPRVAPRIVVAVDPETGELRAPTAAEREGLQAGARQALSGTLPPTRVET